jgi:hypothetical protein
MRAKARAAFHRPGRVWWRDDLDGTLHRTAEESEVFVQPVDGHHPPYVARGVEVVVIRGRQFTRPQTARQRDG